MIIFICFVSVPSHFQVTGSYNRHKLDGTYLKDKLFTSQFGEKDTWCRDDGKVVIRHGSTDRHIWDWCRAEGCEVKGECYNHIGRLACSKNSVCGFVPHSGYSHQWGPNALPNIQYGRGNYLLPPF